MSRWFRMYDDVINDPKVMRLAPAMRWQWVAVLCVASKNGGAIPPAGDLAFSLRMGEDEAGAILAALLGAGLVDDVEGGHVPHNWDGRQYKSDSSTMRVKAFRERHRNGDGNVTGNVSSNVTANVSGTAAETAPEQKQTQTQTQTQKQKEPLSVAVATRPKAEPSRFDEFWSAYPRRKGDNPRKTAETRFNALVKTGLDPQMLIDAIRKYASEKADKIGTEFIPMASTWLNQARWTDHAAIAALQAMNGGGSEMAIEDAVKMFAKSGFWSRHAGPAPGLINCRASVELLAKYGLAEDGRKLASLAAAAA